jgi:hypothetical protein
MKELTLFSIETQLSNKMLCLTQSFVAKEIFNFMPTRLSYAHEVAVTGSRYCKSVVQDQYNEYSTYMNVLAAYFSSDLFNDLIDHTIRGHVDNLAETCSKFNADELQYKLNEEAKELYEKMRKESEKED